MNEREAFEKWKADNNLHMYAHPNIEAVAWCAWQAACAYQRKKDAEICSKMAQGGAKDWAIARQNCAEAILNGDE